MVQQCLTDKQRIVQESRAGALYLWTYNLILFVFADNEHPSDTSVLFDTSDILKEKTLIANTMLVLTTALLKNSLGRGFTTTHFY